MVVVDVDDVQTSKKTKKLRNRNQKKGKKQEKMRNREVVKHRGRTQNKTNERATHIHTTKLCVHIRVYNS